MRLGGVDAQLYVAFPSTDLMICQVISVQSWMTRDHPIVLDRSEHRALRSQAPMIPSNCLVYFFDGASQMSENGKSAAFGALLRIDSVTVARYAEYLGDQNDNGGEYAGVLAVLEHALSQQCARVYIYGDSKVVIRQLNGI